MTLNAGELVVTDTFSAGLTLRFPRITRIRDDKKPHEIETEATLWERFEEVQQSRARSDYQAPLQLGSPISSDSIGPCRFLTESQYGASKKQRKKAPKTVQKVDVVSISTSDVKSRALSGLSIAVVGTTGFSLAEADLDVEESKEAEWMEIAKGVRSAKSVARFIKEHGGTLKLSADGSCDILLGGNRDDPKVATHIQAIENSLRLLQASKGKAKSVSDKKRAAMANCPGVLRWTFVYSLVHRWLSTGVDPKCSIKESSPQMLVPSVLDFLARPVRIEGSTGIDPGVLELDLSKIGTMRRALAFVNDFKKSKDTEAGNDCVNLNWRDASMKLLGADERWVLAAKKQILWPFRKGKEALPRTVIYPAMYDELNKEASSGSVRSSPVASVLPLARVMGAFIVSKLDSSVTHILCDLKQGYEEVMFDDTMEPGDWFADFECGQNFKQMRDNLGFGFSVTLVSPHWVRKRKWIDQSSD